MKTKKITIRVTPETEEKLEKIAEVFNLTYNGRGSKTLLLKAIANNELIVVKNFSKLS